MFSYKALSWPGPQVTLAALLLALTASSLTACSSEEPLTQPGADESEPDSPDAAVGSSQAPDAQVFMPAPVCTLRQVETTDELRPFSALQARVVDEQGQGVPSILAQACGTNLCLAEKTNAQGEVSFLRSPPDEMRRVAFKYGDGLRYAQFALLLPDEPEHELAQQSTVALPPLSEGSPFTLGSVLTQDDITLDLSAVAKVKVDLLSFPEPEQQVFLARQVPAELLVDEQWPQAVPGDQGFGLLLALAPVKTQFCPAAALSLPNTPGWDAGARLEFLLHITDAANYWGEYGTFSVVSSGHVSADGTRLNTDADGGLPELGVVAVRLAP